MNKKYIILLILLSLFFPVIVEATGYTIDAPRLQEKNRKVTISWYQYEPVLITVYKLSYTRKLSNNCSGVETLGANCVMLFQKIGITGNITVVDRGYKKGDQYFIQQNVYLTHNGGYGPFIPR
jgi:hypothetical protein